MKNNNIEQKIKLFLTKNEDIDFKPETLQKLFNIDNNSLRSIISSLRKQNLFIIHNKKSGYKLSKNYNEVLEWTNNEINKHKALLIQYYKWVKNLNHNESKKLYKQLIAEVN